MIKTKETKTRIERYSETYGKRATQTDLVANTGDPKLRSNLAGRGRKQFAGTAAKGES